MRANIQITVKAKFIKDSDGYTAYADVFGAYGMGATKREAEKSLKTTVEIYINEYIKLGTLFEILEKQGFNKKIVLPKAVKNESYKKLCYDIPLGDYAKERLHA